MSTLSLEDQVTQALDEAREAKRAATELNTSLDDRIAAKFTAEHIRQLLGSGLLDEDTIRRLIAEALADYMPPNPRTNWGAVIGMGLILAIGGALFGWALLWMDFSIWKGSLILFGLFGGLLVGALIGAVFFRAGRPYNPYLNTPSIYDDRRSHSQPAWRGGRSSEYDRRDFHPPSTRS